MLTRIRVLVGSPSPPTPKEMTSPDRRGTPFPSSRMTLFTVVPLEDPTSVMTHCSSIHSMTACFSETASSRMSM